MQLVKDCYFKHKGNLLSTDQLSEINSKIVKDKIEWEKNILKPFLKQFVENFGRPEMIKIPNQNYYIGKYEITQREYKFLMRKNMSRTIGDNLPVINVSWFEAMKFCEKLTSRERSLGRLPKGYKYTLPTNEQWEIACRAGTIKENRFERIKKENLSRVAWYRENSGGKIHPVGTKEPNAWGIYDMLGNVEEWCLGLRPRTSSHRAWRGGSYSSSYCDPTSISGDHPEDRFSQVGFRVALVPVDGE